MEYKNKFGYVNRRPSGKWILIFCSDWLKEHWAFYAFIDASSLEKTEHDVKEINGIIDKLKTRYGYGDLYVELIDLPAKDAYDAETREKYPTKLGQFYNKMYDMRGYTHINILEIENWREYYDRN